MIRSISKWIRTHKAVASAVVIAIIAGVPLTVAALHPGFPVSDVDLTSRDVWVTNGQQLLGGRLNRQIDELNGSVVASSADFTVLQDGDTLFMYDPDSSKVEAVNPASTKVTSAIDVPKGSEVSFGGTTLAVLSPKGELWAISAVGDLSFNYVSTPPLLKLGEDAHATVTQSGIVIAVSPSKKTITSISNLAATPVTKKFPAVGTFQLSAVGDAAVMFDQSTNSVITQDGKSYKLPEQGLRLQQVGAESSYAIVATGDALLEVDLGSGSVARKAADIATPITKSTQVSAPVFLDGCAHGAWAGAQRYVLACDGKKVATQDIREPTQTDVVEFRVNRSVIALNDLDNGNTWVPSENMRLVQNWSDVTPPVEKQSEQTSDQKAATQSFKDTLAQRTDINRAPTALDDSYGIRPGRTTVLSVLDNDSDPDGDVLTISAFDRVADTTGTLDAIDGSRALQFTPAASFSGGVSFGYTVDDGRGGKASATVTLKVVPEESNQVPIEVREAGVSVEVSQTVSYNVLADWKDPDGDDLYLTGATPKSGDLVRFTPDGLITFTHQTADTGKKDVTYTLSDGHGGAATGTLTVDVEPTGSLDPVATPDFASTFSNQTVVIKPLDNDLSPSGAQLQLVGLQDPPAGTSASFDSSDRSVTFTSSKAGVYYLKYTVGAGDKTSLGLIRVDVTDKPSDDKVPPIAVKDTAYLRGDQPTTVAVLDNDVSPSGRILGVQSVDVAAALRAKGLVVELLANKLVRITSPAALTEPVSFTYVVSDGIRTATAGVTVVPVPPITKHQPPVALDDAVTVRAGDIRTLDVLANDFHPDAAPMTLDKALVTPPSAGIAFVAANELRFQAPTTPGEYRVGYRVLDPYGESATATATFTVTPLSDKGNRDPKPVPIVSRVIAGEKITVQVPLDGIDPDGDSTQLLSFPTNPTLGAVTSQGTSSFVYTSSLGATGTDTFTYRVYDAFGGTGDGQVQIAVIPAPDQLKQPSAVPDKLSIRPGRVAQADLLANDSDPQGATIKVAKKLIDVPKGIDAKVVGGRYLVVTAPNTEQSFSLRYQLTNDRGGSVVSYVQVTVSKNAPILPPVATDYSISTKDIAGKKSVTINLFPTYAYNPSGATDDMAVTFDGPNAKSAEALAAPGSVRVTPSDTRQAIAYRVTNADDKLSAMGFILVPAAVKDDFADPPHIIDPLPVQYVPMNSTRTWSLKDIVVAPSGRATMITDPKSVSSLQSNGASNYVDKTTLTFTPAKDYRGPASINFTVTDGASLTDPRGVKANLRLNIVVGDPEFKDTPPTFTSPELTVEVGESTSIDLRKSTAQPNPTILSQITYSDITSSNSKFTPTLNGSQLTVTTPRNTPKGTTATLGVTLKWNEFTVKGTISVTAVGSTKPLAVAVDDNLEAQRGDAPTSLNPLTNDSNPFQSTGEPLTVVDAKVQNSGSPATVTFTKNSVKITPNPATKSGSVVVVYTVADATDDVDRQVNGTITLVISDVPDQVQKPTIDNAKGGDRTATFHWQPPATNGKPISGYDVEITPSGAATPANCTTANAASCTFTGLANGTAYSVRVRAENARGYGAWSPSSDTVTPYGTPDSPQPTLASQSKWAPSTLTWTWPTVGDTGGSTTYRWTASSGETGSGVNLTSATIAGKAAGTYSISVVATNGGQNSSAPGTSANATVSNQPIPGAPRNVSTPADHTGATTLTWSWTAPANATADAAGDGLRYTWTASTGASGTTTSTSASISVGDSTANYSLTVYATNSGGQGPSASSGTTHITKSRNPHVAVAWGADAKGQPGCGDDSCHYVKINVYELGSNTSYNATNSQGYSVTVNTDSNGNGSAQFNDYYGYPNNNMTVSAGGYSDTRLWKNAEQ